MSTVSITTQDHTLQVSSPYHKDFPARARALGGKWAATSKTWNFDQRDEQAVRALCVEFFGTDGSAVLESDLVTLRVTIADGTYIHALQGPLFFAGRQIGTAWGRDSGARQGDGVVFIKGRVDSGGSLKNWVTCTSNGAIFEIRDLPRAAAMKAIEDRSGWSETKIAKIEILGDDDTDGDTRRRALEAERAALLARLAELDAELGIAPAPETPEPITEPTAPTTRVSLLGRVATLALTTGANAAALLVLIQTAARQITLPGQLELAI